LKKVIVTTTINRPTEAIEGFDGLKDWDLIVVGDKKTPKDYRLSSGIYISPEEQERYDKELSELIGWNTHARRNFGHLWAKDMGADVIAMVDDDNIPLNGWGQNLFVGRETEVHHYPTELDAFDPIGATNYPQLWHRGFPLQLIHKRDYSRVEKKILRADIQADLWNGDPDVDAICRMIYSPDCEFDPDALPMASNRPSPFDSQNTFISKEVLPAYFFLPHVTPYGRMGDIWIAYHVVSLGFQVVYGKPSVYQKRNVHDLTVDMIDEFIGYEKNLEMVRSINNKTYAKENFWPERTCRAFHRYQEHFA
jgi:hypothetical protein